MTSIYINEERFLRNLKDLAAIGRVPATGGGGLDRRPFSRAEQQARDFVIQRAAEANLATSEDAAANLSIFQSDIDRYAKTVLLGSHLDTVPHGGAFDGALGVLAALEVLQCVQEVGIRPPLRLEAIAFTDEEGRLDGLTGSRLLAGTCSPEDVRYFLSKAAEYPEDLALMRQRVPGGLSLDSLLRVRRPPNQLEAFVELHIEQGPQLEVENRTIGIVNAIFGRISYLVHFHGRSDHAGTTPMPLRSDALVAAATFVVAAQQRAKQDYPDAVLTCGNVTVAPGVYNVVPNHATVWVEFRAGQQPTLDGLEAAVLDEVRAAADANRVTFDTERTTWLAPQPMSERVREATLVAAQELGYSALQLASGALHDAHSMASVTAAGMIFVPSRGGRSHSPEEHTDPADLIAGANTLLRVVLRLAGVH